MIADLLAAERGTQPAASRGAVIPQTYAATAEVMPPVDRSVVVVGFQKSSGLAAILSFFWCGLGQIYTGQILKGVVLMLFYPVLAWFGLGSLFIGFFAALGATTKDQQAAAGGMSLFGILATLSASSMWVYGMVNAYRRAEAINRRQQTAF